MRKRSSVTGDSRPPLKTLKSSVPRSNVKDFPRAAKIPRVHAIKAEVMYSKSGPSDSVVTSENISPTELGQNEENTVGRKCQNAEAPCKVTEGSVVRTAQLTIKNLVEMDRNAHKQVRF